MIWQLKAVVSVVVSVGSGSCSALVVGVEGPASNSEVDLAGKPAASTASSAPAA